MSCRNNGAGLKVLREVTGIPRGVVAGGSVWNRDFRYDDCRGGRFRAGGSKSGEERSLDWWGLLGSGTGALKLEGGLRMLENHPWNCDAGDGSAGVSTNDSDLLRLCFADLVSISPLKASFDLCLKRRE